MAGGIVKTEGIVLRIRPWSRTSHVTTWLTPDRGPVATVVKGAVRPKSAFLGQYDLFYTCELLYYARSRGDVHALREASPLALREGLRGRWRETALAGYAAEIFAELAPSGAESAGWYSRLARFLDGLAAGSGGRSPYAMLIRLEMEILELSGLAPDFSGMDGSKDWTFFSIDRGRCCEGERMARLPRSAVAALRGENAGGEDEAVRFLGMFLAYHLDLDPEIRRSVLRTIAKRF